VSGQHFYHVTKRNLMGAGQVNEVAKQIGPRLPIHLSKKTLFYLLLLLWFHHMLIHTTMFPPIVQMASKTRKGGRKEVSKSYVFGIWIPGI
jgi:hypothetical protein